MYLNNKNLRKIVDEMISGCENNDYPFDPDKQVSVCSIDIRVDNVFWITRKRRRRSIDLGSNMIFEISPERLWERKVLEPNGYILLKPGEMILGRTYERISMPIKYVGKINTRSSYARLGLSTACNCDLINPGYEGHVPLELTNTTPNTFRIRPYFPLCQVFVMPLHGGADESYNDDKYESKYMDDKGGPSVWWRDALVKKISSKVFTNQVSDAAIERLRDQFEEIDDDGLYRVEKLLESKSWASSDHFLTEFVKGERRRRNFYRVRTGLAGLLSTGMLGASLLQMQRAFDPAQGYDGISILIWFLFLMSLPFSLYNFFQPKRMFYVGDGE